jgi:hypothetical protein
MRSLIHSHHRRVVSVKAIFPAVQARVPGPLQYTVRYFMNTVRATRVYLIHILYAFTLTSPTVSFRFAKSVIVKCRGPLRFGINYPSLFVVLAEFQNLAIRQDRGRTRTHRNVGRGSAEYTHHTIPPPTTKLGRTCAHVGKAGLFVEAHQVVMGE